MNKIIRRDKNGQPITQKTCPHCETEFEGVPTRKYCSAKCSKEVINLSDAGGKWIIFNRDGCRCVYCGITAEHSELRPDHIIASSKGGADTASNLVTSCIQCNSTKHAQDLSPETMKYVIGVVNSRNKEQGIHPSKIIKGSHVRTGDRKYKR